MDFLQTFIYLFIFTKNAFCYGLHVFWCEYVNISYLWIMHNIFLDSVLCDTGVPQGSMLYLFSVTDLKRCFLFCFILLCFVLFCFLKISHTSIMAFKITKLLWPRSGPHQKCLTSTHNTKQPNTKLIVIDKSISLWCKITKKHDLIQNYIFCWLTM